MKQQTFIAFEFKNGEDFRTDFYRFSCKRIETVKKQYIEALKQYGADSFVFKDCDLIKVYATPDGYTQEVEPSAIWAKKELLQLI